MNVVGLDLSLTATGIALADGSFDTIKPTTKGMARLAAIEAIVMDYTAGCDLAVIEGYSMGSRNSQSHALGELGGVVRLALHRQDTPYVDVPPTRLKKWATGKGNADKDAVLVKAVKRFDPSPENNNEADAAWLRDIGMAWTEGRTLNASQAEIVKAIEWPTLTARRPWAAAT